MMVGMFQLLFAVTTLVVYTAGQDHSCPPWKDSYGEMCQHSSGFNKAILYCDPRNQKVFITAGMCVSVSGSNNKTFVGDCPYVPVHNVVYHNKLFKQLPENISELNTDIFSGSCLPELCRYPVCLGLESLCTLSVCHVPNVMDSIAVFFCIFCLS